MKPIDEAPTSLDSRVNRALRRMASENEGAQAPGRVRNAVMAAWDARAAGLPLQRTVRRPWWVMPQALDRYAVDNENSVPVGDRVAGHGARSAPKPTTLNQPRALTGFQGQRPWLIGAVLVLLALTLTPLWWWRPDSAGTSEAEGTPQAAGVDTRTSPALTADLVEALTSDPASLRILRVRMPSSALASFGIPVDDVSGRGATEVEVVLGEDGVARSVRQIRMVYGQE